MPKVSKNEVPKKFEECYGEPEETVESSVSGVTIQQFESEIQKWKEIKDKIEQDEYQLKKLKEEENFYKNRCLLILKENNLNSFRSSYGTVIKAERWSWKTPKSDEQKEAFYGYLKEKGLLDTMLTVNSMSLNAFCKKEMEAAKEKGDIDFVIPGLDEPSVDVSVSLRKS